MFNSGRKWSAFVLLWIMSVPFVLYIAEDGGQGTCSACPELTAQREDCHAGPHMTHSDTADKGTVVKAN